MSTLTHANDPLPEPHPVFLRVVSLILCVVARLYFRLSCHVDRQELQRLSTQPRPLIVVFNHTSHLDVPAVGLCLGVSLMRRVIMPGKKELFEKPAMAWLMRQGGAIPLDRGMNDTHAVRALLRALQAGRLIMMSPEGTRSYDGQTQNFKPGFVKLAHRAQALILPVGIQGAYAAFPRTAKFPRPRKVCVHVGAPIDTAAHLPPKPSHDEFVDFAEEVRQKVIDLTRE